MSTKVILYIVFGIIWFVFRQLKKSQKPASKPESFSGFPQEAEEQTLPKTKTSSAPFGNESIFPVKEEYSTIENANTITQGNFPVNTTFEQTDSSSQPLYLEETKSNKNKILQGDASIAPNEAKKTEKKAKLPEPFDLQKAVIYSTILNRPYE